MDWGDVLPLLVAVIAALPGVLALIEQRKKNEAETRKSDAEAKKLNAETEDIHAQVADRWAEHVRELMERDSQMQEEIKGLRLDITQVRRENELYRKELIERDLIIADLRDWAARLVKQIEEEYKGVPVKMKVHPKGVTHGDD